MDNILFEKEFLDFNEEKQQWHVDLRLVPENERWVNICYGNPNAIACFCRFIDVIIHEFHKKFKAEQIIRLAECFPGLVVHRPSHCKDDEYESHKVPIDYRNCFEKCIDWTKFWN